MLKHKYESPILQVSVFENQDVVTASKIESEENATFNGYAFSEWW